MHLLYLIPLLFVSYFPFAVLSLAGLAIAGRLTTCFRRGMGELRCWCWA